LRRIDGIDGGMKSLHSTLRRATALVSRNIRLPGPLAALSRTQLAQACLAAMVAWFVGWDLWAILVDRRPTYGPDSALFYTLKTYLAGDLHEKLRVLLDAHGKGITHCVLALLLAPLTGDVARAVSLVSVMAHGASMWLAHALGRSLLNGRRAGLWAALLTGASPMMFGWARLEYREPLLGVVLSGTLLLMLRTRRDELRTYASLGALLGLGIMTKLSFFAFMLGPGLWFLAKRARPRRWRHLLVLAGVMAAVSFPWVLYNAECVVGNALAAARYSPLTAAEKAAGYLALPGVWWLAGLAALSLPVLWWSRQVDREALVLLGVTLGVSVGLFLFHFDYWSRYLVPVFPLAAVAGGAGLAFALGGLRPPVRCAVSVVAALCLLGLFGYWNLAPTGPTEKHVSREYHAGVVRPDVRRHDGFPRALRWLRNRVVVVVFDSQRARAYTEGLEVPEMVWASRGLFLERIDLEQARRRLGVGEHVAVLLVRRLASPAEALRELAALVPSDHMNERMRRSLVSGYRWLHGLALRPRTSVTDPDGTTFETYLVGPRRP
jgi:hypothetical protein